jgi:hypothetical protein
MTAALRDSRENSIMKTPELSQEQVEARISRFARLTPLAVQDDPEMPLAAKGIIHCRELLSVIGLKSATPTPINPNAPIRDAAGMAMTIGVRPPDTRPSLHARHETYGAFTMPRGRFEIRWNDDGEQSATLDRLDAISFPPRIDRCFKNVSDEDGIIQIVIAGGVHDITGIDVAPSVGERPRGYGGVVFKKSEDIGSTFTAHENAAA